MARMTTKQRRRKFDECGAGAFGDATGPKAKKAGRPRYPLTKVGGGCEPDCSSMLLAFRRARQQHESKIAKRIKRKARTRGCRWAP